MVLFKKRCLDIAKAVVLSNSWMCPCLQTKMYPGFEFLTDLNFIFLSNITTKLVERIRIYILCVKCIAWRRRLAMTIFYSLNGIIFQQYSGGVNALLNAWQIYFVYIISNSYRVIHCRICFPNICIFLAYFVLSIISKLKRVKSASYLPYFVDLWTHHEMLDYVSFYTENI